MGLCEVIEVPNKADDALETEPPASLTNRCTGHCCRRFQINFNLKTVIGRTRHIRELIDRGVAVSDRDRADLQVAEMLIPLGVSTLHEDGVSRHRVPWYRCRNVLPNGDCGIYQDRPEMCRIYPTIGTCLYAGCTWRDARLKEVA